jgi:hypothetical protein
VKARRDASGTTLRRDIAIRNLERAGVPRSAAMAMAGHRTEAIYRRYAIADESMLRDGGDRLAALHSSDARRKMIPTIVRFQEAKEA